MFFFIHIYMYISLFHINQRTFILTYDFKYDNDDNPFYLFRFISSLFFSCFSFIFFFVLLMYFSLSFLFLHMFKFLFFSLNKCDYKIRVNYIFYFLYDLSFIFLIRNLSTVKEDEKLQKIGSKRLRTFFRLQVELLCNKKEKKKIVYCKQLHCSDKYCKIHAISSRLP